MQFCMLTNEICIGCYGYCAYRLMVNIFEEIEDDGFITVYPEL